MIRTLSLIFSLSLAITFGAVEGHPLWASALCGAFVAVFVIVSERGI